MNEIITVTGCLAKKVIESGHGSVIAVFDSSLYLCSGLNDTALACVGTTKMVQGPINISTSFNYMPHVAVNARWFSNDRTLRIEGIDEINCSPEVSDYTRPRSTIHWPQLHAVQNLLKQYTRGQHTDRHSREHLQQGINSLQLWLELWPQSGVNDIPDQLRTLIGCGEGLTPSGDDILIGALIALDYLGQDRMFRVLADWILLEAPTATNRISLAHLNAACQAMAIEPLHNFVTALYTDMTATLSAIEQLENYGHQSGLDAMRGVLAVTAGLHPDNRAEFHSAHSKFHHSCSVSFAK